MSERPPPYRPFFPEGPPSSTFSPAFLSPPTIFPGSTYQTFPQTFTAPDLSIFPPGSGGQEAFPVMPPGYYGDHQGNKHQFSHPPKPTVLVMEPRANHPAAGIGSYLASCATALCCCCLWDLLHR